MDQAFSVQAGVISRHTFDNANDVTQILDSSSRSNNPAEQQRVRRAGQVYVESYKLDEAADWKQWVSMVGVRVKGLRPLKYIHLSLAFGIWKF